MEYWVLKRKSSIFKLHRSARFELFSQMLAIFPASILRPIIPVFHHSIIPTGTKPITWRIQV